MRMTTDGTHSIPDKCNVLSQGVMQIQFIYKIYKLLDIGIWFTYNKPVINPIRPNLNIMYHKEFKSVLVSTSDHIIQFNNKMASILHGIYIYYKQPWRFSIFTRKYNSRVSFIEYIEISLFEACCLVSN